MAERESTGVWCAGGGPEMGHAFWLRLRRLPKALQRAYPQQRLVEERQQAIDALTASEARYREMFEDMPVALYRTTPDGRFLDANPAVVEMLGYPSREALVGIHVAELYPDAKARAEWQWRLERAGDRAGLELQLRRLDGEIIWVRDTSRTFRDPDGRAIYYEGSLADITQRKRAEAALQACSNRLEEMVEERTRELQAAQEQLVRREKLAVMGQLAGSVSHELRNPLGVISSAAQILRLSQPDADETTREFLDMITQEVGTAEKIIYDLLDFSRTQAVEPEATPVADLVSTVVEKHPPPARIRLTTLLDPDLPPVLVDTRQMHQVLTNLFSNAYDAMPSGGQVTVGACSENGTVRLSIADTGCGMSEKQLATLFEPLFTTKPHGIGLGMAVVKTLVERNGGSIEVQSASGQGTTCTVSLAADREAVPNLDESPAVQQLVAA